MSPTCQKALRDLMIACADTKLLLAYHYGEWTFGPPELEAAIACCSLCQAELGHVRLLHGILNKHYGDDPDQLVESRAPHQFANISFLDEEIQDWSEFVAANYVVDLALTSLLYSMRKSSFKPLHMSLEKMLQEERYHVHHGQGWFRTLAKRSKETKTAVEKNAQIALRSVVEWFGPTGSEQDAELVEAEIKSDLNSSILQGFLGELGKLADDLDMDLALVKSDGDNWEIKKPTSWDGWNPTTRRTKKAGPNEDILYHLRGSKNKVFKLN